MATTINVTKKAAKKTVVASKASKKKVQKFTVPFNGEYFYAVGRRKTAIAQVRVYKKSNSSEKEYVVNGKTMKEYFPTSHEWDFFNEPIILTGLDGKIVVTVLVKGGGLSGQSQAVRLGIARALVKMDEGLRPILKSSGLLTRDSRVVERKKPGLRKARRRPQWSKR